ncbi:MAG: DUF1674 domain-containing protein [Gammaproteobacteria bacterium]|nr:DUF1674 domain-containing protein [Gammaproteobacteria bacterium]
MSARDPKNKAEKVTSKSDPEPDSTPPETEDRQVVRSKEIGGRGGLDPTRYGDWEKAGRCIDF